MKKILFTILSLSILNCGFALDFKKPSQPVDLSQLAQTVVLSEAFANVLQSTFEVKTHISQQLFFHGGTTLVQDYNSFLVSCNNFETVIDYYKSNNLDTILLIDAHTNQLRTFYELFSENPDLLNLNDQDKIEVLRLSLDILKDSAFRDENPRAYSVIKMEEIANNTITSTARLTTSEAIECVAEAVIGSFSAVGGIVGTIIGIASGAGLTSAALNSLIRNAIRVGTFALGGSAIGYLVGCILWNAYF